MPSDGAAAVILKEKTALCCEASGDERFRVEFAIENRKIDEAV